MQNKAPRPALLALEDGLVFSGRAFGASGEKTGEAVFQTALTGYQEILTDPSYRGQIVVMTAPQIGNVGTTPEDDESRQVFCSGFAIRELSPLSSNWRSRQTLDEYMLENDCVGIEGIDTRALTLHLRTHGAKMAVISTTTLDEKKLIAKAKAAPRLEGRDLVAEVTCAKPYEWTEPSWQLQAPKTRFHVVAYDFGVKRNILRNLVDAGCRVTVVPAGTPAKEAIALKPDGFFLSNGPGDPAAVGYAAEAVRGLMETKKPLFGICLGHQILGLALGGKTYKLRFGHHGANHPVMDLGTKRVEITSQNHGFAVSVDSLGDKAELTHVSLNDRTVEGLRLKDAPVFSVQYHPEASPGPHDAAYLFGRFVKLLEKR